MEKIVVLGNGIDWLDDCYSGMDDPSVGFYNNRIPIKSNNKLFNFIIRCFFSIRNRSGLVVKMPFRWIWFNFSIFKSFVNYDDSVKFIIYDHNRISLDILYLKWLRKKYKKCKLAFVFTNVASKSGAGQYNMLYKLNDMYDYVFAFDPADSDKYGYNYNYLVYKPNLSKLKNTNNYEYDCLFVGSAKERLDLLHNIYIKLIELGLKPCFYILGVEENRQLKDSKIHYNERIPYKLTMELTAKSRCIIDILQEGSTGIALRICESVVWNKLIITDNPYVLKEPFYSKNNISVISSAKEINLDFLSNNPNVKDKYKLLFDPNTLFNKIL